MTLLSGRARPYSNTIVPSPWSRVSTGRTRMHSLILKYKKDGPQTVLQSLLNCKIYRTEQEAFAPQLVYSVSYRQPQGVE